MRKTWRMLAEEVIVPLEKEYRNKPFGDFKRALFDAYPFGERRYFPYKMWLQVQREVIQRHPDYRRIHKLPDVGKQMEFETPGGEK